MHMRILASKVKMASSRLLASFMWGVKFLTYKLKFLESYKHFYITETDSPTYKMTYFSFSVTGMKRTC